MALVKATLSFKSFVSFPKTKNKSVGSKNNKSVSEIYSQVTKQILNVNPSEFSSDYFEEEKKELVASLRLTKGEYERLQFIAEKEGMNVSRYMGYIFRGFFTAAAFTNDQIFYLKRILGQFGKLGSDINQIVKILRKMDSKVTVEEKYLLEMLEILQEVREILLAIVKSNNNSWQNVRKIVN